MKDERRLLSMANLKNSKTLKNVPTTAEVLNSAMTRVENEIKSLNAQKDGALSVFRATANKLEAVNEGLTKSVHTLDEMIKFASEQKNAVEKNITDNENVRDKIISIIGE
jgi:predicted  nucleic acid-binding Zn-ribbon protein